MDKENNIKLQNSFEKVYLVESECLIRILEGIAEYKNNIYYFDCIHSDKENNWSEKYNLTLLNKEIIELKLWNFSYYCEWHSQSSTVPYWEDYKNDREQNSFEEIKKWYGNSELLQKAEQNYLNQKIIDKYLSDNKPTIKLHGKFYVNDIEYNINETFYENINEYNIVVKWNK
jgi:hypothetical protein